MRQNGVEIRFTASPSADTTQQLKSKGFRWSFRQRVWYVRYTEALHQWAIDLCGDTEHSDNPASVALQHYSDAGKRTRQITLAVLTSQGKVPQGILKDEIRAGKLEVAQYKAFNGMTDSTDYFKDDEIVWEDATMDLKHYDIERLRKMDVNTHWTNSITLDDDGKISLGNLKFRYKTDVVGHDYNPGMERQKIKDLEAQAAAAKKQAASARLDLTTDFYHVPRNRPAKIGAFKIETPLSPDDFVDAEPFRAVMEKDGYRITGLLTAKNMVTSTTRVLFGNAPAVENRENVWQFKADFATPSYVSRYDKFKKEEPGDTSDFPEWSSPTYPYYLWQGILQAARDAKYEHDKLTAAKNPRGAKIHEGRREDALKRLAIQKRQWLNYESKNPAPLRLVTGEGPAEQAYRALLWQSDLYAMKLAEKDVNKADVEAARANAEAELRGETVAEKMEPTEAPKDPNHIEGFNYDVSHDLDGFKYVRQFKQDGRETLSARQLAYLGEVENSIARKLQNEGVNAYEAAFVEKTPQSTKSADKDPLYWNRVKTLGDVSNYFPGVEFFKSGNVISKDELVFAETDKVTFIIRDMGLSFPKRWAILQHHKGSQFNNFKTEYRTLSEAIYEAEKIFERFRNTSDVIIDPYVKVVKNADSENKPTFEAGDYVEVVTDPQYRGLSGVVTMAYTKEAGKEAVGMYAVKLDTQHYAKNFKGENLKLAERKENLPEPKFKNGDRAKYRETIVTILSDGAYDTTINEYIYLVQGDTWTSADNAAERFLQPYKEVQRDKLKYRPATERALPFGTGEGQAKKLEELKAAKYKTASQEALIALMERRLNADPSKWQPGDGVGIKLNVKKVSNGGQVNRGFAIIYVDAPTKTALVAAVKDTGLQDGGIYVSPQETARFIGRMTWEPIGDLIRDRDYDLSEKGLERYQQKAVYAGLLVEADDAPEAQVTQAADNRVEETDSETYGAIRLNAHDRPFFDSPMMVGGKPNFTRNFNLAGMVPKKHFEQTIANLPFKSELLEFVTIEQFKRERNEAKPVELAQVVTPKPAQYPKSVSQLNSYLKGKYPEDILVKKGNRYYYIFSDDDDTALKIAGLYSSTVEGVWPLEAYTYEQWKAEIDRTLSDWQSPDPNPVFPDGENLAAKAVNSKLQTARTSLKLLQKALPRLEGARKKTAETEIKLLTRFIEKSQQ